MMMHYQLLQLSQTSTVIGEIYGQVNAVRLAQLNARTSTIVALTGLPKVKVRQIILAISKRVPPKGRAIENLDGYIKNKKHRRHVSFIINNYRKCIILGLSHIEAIMQAYMLYQKTLSSDARSYVDIDHAHYLIQETNKSTDFDMIECQCCKSKYFYYKYELPLICPFCTDKKELKLTHKESDLVKVAA